MSISGILFLFLFLPLALAVYHLVADSKKEFALLVISLLFYACGDLWNMGLIAVAAVITVILGRLIGSAGTSPMTKKILLTGGVLFAGGGLLFYKYADFILSKLHALFPAQIAPLGLLAPMGLSFFAFKQISYLADVYLGRVTLAENPLHDALYLTFFPQMQSGPIARYSDMQPVVCQRGQRYAFFADGAYRFVVGFNKKILLANTLSNIVHEVFLLSPAGMSVGYAWLGSLCFSLQLYYDFSGYSDMAIGIGKMFGYQCPENFMYPYMSGSVSEFWRRWHITLGSWFRDYVYIPLGGSRVKSRLVLARNLLAVWILTGMWHGANGHYLVWGIGYFAAVAFEKLTGLPKKLKSKWSKGIYRICTLLFINFQWVIFHAGNLSEGIVYIRNMFYCPANAPADTRTLFLLKDYFVFIAGAVLLCFPIGQHIRKIISRSKAGTQFFDIVSGIAALLLFAWALSFVAAGSNDPFVYAHF